MAHNGQGLSWNVKAAGLGKVLKRLGGSGPIAGCAFEIEALKVRGDLDIHGRADRGHDIAQCITALVQHPGQNVIAIGRDNDALDRQAHLFGNKPGKGVAKIAGRHGKANGTVGRAKGGSGGEIIDALCGDAGPIDRIDAGQVDSLAEILILEHGLNNGLAVVKRALDGNGAHIVLRRRGHKPALNLADAPFGEEHHHSGMASPGKGLDRRTARIARGGSNNGHGPALSGQGMVIEPGQQLHGHILKGQAGAVEQLHLPDAVIELGQGHDRRMGKTGIGLGRHLIDYGAGNFVTGELGQDLGSDLGIGPASKTRDLGLRKLRPSFWHIKAAIGGEASQHGIQETNGGGGPAGRYVFHLTSGVFGSACRHRHWQGPQQGRTRSRHILDGCY